MNAATTNWRAKLLPAYRLAARVPPVLRSVIGIILMLAGVMGIILPLLGVWMVPLGFIFISLDIPPLRTRVDAWLNKDAG